MVAPFFDWRGTTFDRLHYYQLGQAPERPPWLIFNGGGHLKVIVTVNQPFKTPASKNESIFGGGPVMRPATENRPNIYNRELGFGTTALITQFSSPQPHLSLSSLSPRIPPSLSHHTSRSFGDQGALLPPPSLARVSLLPPRRGSSFSLLGADGGTRVSLPSSARPAARWSPSSLLDADVALSRAADVKKNRDCTLYRSTCL